MSVEKKILYAFPECLPSTHARGVSVVNTVYEWQSENPNLVMLVDSPSTCSEINQYYDVDINPLSVMEISKRFIIKSNRVYVARLKRLIKKNPGCAVYTRHLKIADQVLSDSKLECDVFYEVHEFFYRSVPSDKPKRRDFFRSMESRVLQGSKGLVFWNHNLERIAEAEFSGLQKNRLIATSGIREVPSVKNSVKRKSRDRLIYLGTLKAWKGVDRLISNFSKTGFSSLSIVGGSKSEINALKELCESLGVSDCVEFLGMMPNLKAQEWLSEEVSVAVIPLVGGRYAEFSTPIKLFEYMYAGAVVVCPNLPTITDYIHDGVEAICFDQSSDDSLVSALELARLQTDSEHDEMSRKASRCAAGFTWRRRAQRINQFVLASCTRA